MSLSAQEQEVVSHVQLQNRERDKNKTVLTGQSQQARSLCSCGIYQSFFFSLLYYYFSAPPFIAKDSLRAVRKSSYRHPSILSFSHNLFLYIIILVISFYFFVLRKGVSIVLSSRLFFVFSIIFPFNWVCKLVSSTNKEQQKKPDFPHQTGTTSYTHSELLIGDSLEVIRLF